MKLYSVIWLVIFMTIAGQPIRIFSSPEFPSDRVCHEATMRNMRNFNWDREIRAQAFLTCEDFTNG